MQSQVEWYRDNNSVYYRLKHVLGTVFFVMATRKMHALVQVHLTTANQSEIRKAYLVSV